MIGVESINAANLLAAGRRRRDQARRERVEIADPDLELGAAAYAIKAVRAAAPGSAGEEAGRLECSWQRDQLPTAVRELVLDDQRLRNELCWSVFDC